MIIFSSHAGNHKLLALVIEPDVGPPESGFLCICISLTLFNDEI
jgi:hypothetical protein